MASRRSSSASGSKVQIGRQPSQTRSQISGRASSAGGHQSGVKATTSKPSTSKAPPSNKPPREFALPAFSLPPKVISKTELEKMQKKTIRRNAPPGEDLPCIKTVLKTIKNQKISIEEFISLIAPSTGDGGETLRTVMNEDLNSFRKLARKVYETITQDNSDVLLNQQLQLSEYYKERKTLFNQKMMNNIEQIYVYAPNFDFDRYAKEKDKYLQELFPIPEELQIEPEEMETMKRQAAYHRLQWLRSEGERLREENESLKQRLKQMTLMHRNEQHKMNELERNAEAKKEALESAQAEKVEELEVLSESLEKTIIAKERNIRLKEDRNLLEPLPPQQASRKGKSAVKKKKVMRRPAWNEEAAMDIDTRVVEEGKAAETSKIKGAFHFSPIKTPPSRQSNQRVTSPFHYSPPKTPPGSRVQEDVAVQPIQAVRQQQQGRRSLAPRDSWGGFY